MNQIIVILFVSISIISCNRNEYRPPKELEIFDGIYREYHDILVESGGNHVHITLDDIKGRISDKDQAALQVLENRYDFFEFSGLADATGFSTTTPLIKVSSDKIQYVLMRSGVWRQYPRNVILDAGVNREDG